MFMTLLFLNCRGEQADQIQGVGRSQHRRGESLHQGRQQHGPQPQVGLTNNIVLNHM